MDLNDWVKLLIPFRTWLERLGLLVALLVLVSTSGLVLYVPYCLGVLAGQRTCIEHCLICDTGVDVRRP